MRADEKIKSDQYSHFMLSVNSWLSTRKTYCDTIRGRLIPGIGAGWFERDYKEYGYDFGTAGSRLEALEHSLQVIKHRWEVDVPKPTRKIPILVGGGGEKKTLRITATYADIWHSFGDPATYAHKIVVLNNWCAEVGRNPQEIEHAVSPQQVDASTLDTYVKAGASHFIVGLSAAWDLTRVAQVLKWRSERYS